MFDVAAAGAHRQPQRKCKYQRPSRAPPPLASPHEHSPPQVRSPPSSSPSLPTSLALHSLPAFPRLLRRTLQPQPQPQPPLTASPRRRSSARRRTLSCQQRYSTPRSFWAGSPSSSFRRSTRLAWPLHSPPSSTRLLSWASHPSCAMRSSCCPSASLTAGASQLPSWGQLARRLSQASPFLHSGYPRWCVHQPASHKPAPMSTSALPTPYARPVLTVRE